MRRASSTYTPRRPHDTVLYRLAREHYETFVASARATYSAPLPRYVTDAFERYLAGGDFSRGVLRCFCEACRHDVLVPFSCKQRGLCPRCGTRRMGDEAAFVTDRILPSVPVRQWVLSLPFELRGLAATKPDVLTAFGRIVAEEIARTTKGGGRSGGGMQQRDGLFDRELVVGNPRRRKRVSSASRERRRAPSVGPRGSVGASTLTSTTTSIAADVVFEKQGGGVRVHEAKAPDKNDIAELLRRVHDRSLAWLRRHGYLDERPAEERGNEAQERTPMEAFARPRARRRRIPGPTRGAKAGGRRRGVRAPRGMLSAGHEGWNVHYAVRPRHRHVGDPRAATPATTKDASASSASGRARPSRSSASRSLPTGASPTG